MEVLIWRGYLRTWLWGLIERRNAYLLFIFQESSDILCSLTQPCLLIPHLLTLYMVFWPTFLLRPVFIAYWEQVYPQPIIKILCIKHIKIQTKCSFFYELTTKEKYNLRQHSFEFWYRILLQNILRKNLIFKIMNRLNNPSWCEVS